VKTEYQYIVFVPAPPKPKTKVWRCLNKRSRNELGIIKWYGPWRRYAYEPTVQGVYTGECLDAIKDFLSQADHEQEQLRAQQKIEK